MAKAPFVLLPGLDGTAALFQRFIEAAPAGVDLRPVRLPEEPLTYDQLADGIANQLPEGPVVVVAESFSGPIAVALAARRPLAALVFCNSFVAAPRWRLLRLLILPMFFKLRPPAFLLRRYMVGPRADDALVGEVAKAVASAAASLLAFRLRAVLSEDKTAAFGALNVPVLYLRATQDRLVPEAALRRMVAARAMSIARIPGPHLLLQANPKGAWDAISKFLDQQR